jgi:hypothetical protein
MEIKQTYTAKFKVPKGRLEETLYKVQTSYFQTFSVWPRADEHEVELSTDDKEFFDQQVEQIKQLELVAATG